MRVPFVQRGHDLTLQLLDASDAPWIAALVDAALAIRGTWRAVAAQLERVPLDAGWAQRAAAVAALGRALGRDKPVVPARKVRAHVFGRPALSAGERSERIAAAAAALELRAEDVEAALWSDLPGERRVAVPRQRPDELAIARTANLAIVQAAMRRTHALRLRVWGRARSIDAPPGRAEPALAISRAAAAGGLLASLRPADGGIELNISGPLSLFHRTTVYGRALGALVPHLAACERFELAARCDLGRGTGTLRLQPPVLLPPAPPASAEHRVVRRLARDLTAAGHEVVRDPEPIASGDDLLLPDLVVGRWAIEVVGYWTLDYVTTKLARYDAAGRDVVLCVDAERALGDVVELPTVVPYVARIDAAAVARVIDTVLASRP